MNWIFFEALQKKLSEVPTIYFDFDKSSVRKIHQKDLERIATMMKRMPRLTLSIEGHTDQRGSEDYNKSLSERRATAVRQYLLERSIETERIQSNWFGKTKPVHNCDLEDCTEDMHQLNRRTELILRK